MAKADELRRRPESIRLFYMAISASNIHTGASYGGLAYVVKNHGVESLYLSDLVSGVVREIEESAEDFMTKWRAHYDDTTWDYFAEWDAAKAAAKRRKS